MAEEGKSGKHVVAVLLGLVLVAAAMAWLGALQLEKNNRARQLAGSNELSAAVLNEGVLYEAKAGDPGLVEVWRDPHRFTRNRRFEAEMLEGGCKGCEHGAACRAGCPDLAWCVTGSVFDNPYCLHRIEREGVDLDPSIWTMEETEGEGAGKEDP